ncbi:MAG: zinc-binding dehydrogenase [Saprospiraceae bacterium]
MRAALLSGIHQPLKITDLDPLVQEEGSCLVDVHYCSLNHRDYWISIGQYAGLKFPVILGSDVCGSYDFKSVIINPGTGWGSDHKAQSASYQILGLPENGGLAEQVLTRPDRLHVKPEHLTDLEAAALPLAGLTAFRALVVKAKPQRNESVLITGIGGGVALFAMQFAIALGLKVYVTSSSDEKLNRALSMGASGGFNYKSADWQKGVQSEAGLMDIIIDGAGGEDFGKLVKVAAPGGRIVSYGATRGSWSGLQVQSVFWKQLSIFGSTMGSDEDFSNMIRMVNDYKIVPVVDKVLPLDQINEAIQYMAVGSQFGKIVIDLRS